MARSCYNYSFFYKRSTNQIMSKPPTAQRRRRRRSVSPDGQASPQQPNAEKIAKTHLHFTHFRGASCSQPAFSSQKRKKDHTKNDCAYTDSECKPFNQTKRQLTRPDLQNKPTAASSLVWRSKEWEQKKRFCKEKNPGKILPSPAD